MKTPLALLTLAAILCYPLISPDAAEPAHRRATLPHEATIKLTGKDLKLQANAHGEFPRQSLAPEQRVEIRLQLPLAERLEPLTITAMDGGRVLTTGPDGERAAKPGARHSPDASRRLDFTFIADKHPGIYRVLVKKGREQRTLEFWVGPPLPIRR